MENSVKNLTPEAVLAQANASGVNAEPAEDTTVTISLESSMDGYFVLKFDGPIPATSSYDWIGLFNSADAPETRYTAGNWDWAKNGSSFTCKAATNTAGYQARYYRMQQVDGVNQYVCLAKSNVSAPWGPA